MERSFADYTKHSVNTSFFRIKTSALHSFLFNVAFVIEFIVLLIPAWSASPIWNIVSYDSYIKISTNFSQLLFLALSFFIILSVHKINLRILFFLILLDFFLILSLTFTGFKSGLLAIIAIPITYIVIFDTTKRIRTNRNTIKSILIILLFWSITPIILFALVPNLRASFFITFTGEVLTFSGFAIHRNFYGMIIGLPIIILLTVKINWPFIVKFILLIFCLIGMFLCASRSLMLSVTISCIFYYFFRTKKIFIKRAPLLVFVIMILGVGYSIYKSYSIRPEKTNDDRVELYQGYFNKIKQHPIIGAGEEVTYYSSQFPDGSPAHNFILQSSANYGVPLCLTFLLFLLYIFFKLKTYFRIFLLYLIIWGLTQPYFGFSIPSSQVCIPILLGIILDNSTNENCILYTKHT